MQKRNDVRLPLVMGQETTRSKLAGFNADLTQLGRL